MNIRSGSIRCVRGWTELKSSLNIDACNEELERLHMQSESPGFWDDHGRARSRSMKQTSAVWSPRSGATRKCARSWDDLMTICEMALEENDDSMLDELKDGYHTLEERDGKRAAGSAADRRI